MLFNNATSFAFDYCSLIFNKFQSRRCILLYLVFSNFVQVKTISKQYLVHVVTCTRYCCTCYNLCFSIVQIITCHACTICLYRLQTCTKLQLVHDIYHVYINQRSGNFFTFGHKSIKHKRFI